MRKQYHSRVVDGQNHIWDVHKLIEISRDFPVQDITLKDIKGLDGDHWYDISSELPTPRDIAVHAKLIIECDLDYPVILSQDGHVMDGMHRCCRALVEGLETIKAVQFNKDPKPDYINVDIETLPHDEPIIL